MSGPHVSHGWHLSDVQLSFGVGDRVAFRIPFRVLSHSLRLAEHRGAVAAPMPPTSPPLAAGAVGYMIRALPIVEPLPVLTRIDGWIRYVTLKYAHCYIDLSIGVDAYRAKFSGKTRQTIMRKLRKFEVHCGGRIDWRTYRTPDEMLAFHRMARQVSARTYQEQLLDAGIPADPKFVERMCELAARDEARGWLLFDRDRPISYLYCPAEEDSLVYAYLGYDPDYMKLSVGTVLQWLAVEQLYQEKRYAFFDFTEGQSDHKRLFATHELQCANVLFLQLSASRLLIVRFHAAADRIVATLRSRAERWGIKARLRRLMRFGLRGTRPLSH